ncbi:Uncharacterized protein TCM_001780 [Theobroma cacao]|uniref:Uncharacterized protein n=1 Tax=Theobroma cacao TaxID=3641 RepID=A0A061DKG1_THECC|nr:Uncharacterized protein TCM_001780 [Theobroma cacao]
MVQVHRNHFSHRVCDQEYGRRKGNSLIVEALFCWKKSFSEYYSKRLGSDSKIPIIDHIIYFRVKFESYISTPEYKRKRQFSTSKAIGD